jgi:ankyrin repeat protein
MELWTKKLVVHTVGFSRDHDFQFLDELRKCGTEVGTFRYAEPSDPEDTLCSKLSDLAQSIVSSSCCMAKLYSSFPIKNGPRNTLRHLSSEDVSSLQLPSDMTYETQFTIDMDENHGQINLFGEFGRGSPFPPSNVRIHLDLSHLAPLKKDGQVPSLPSSHKADVNVNLIEGEPDIFFKYLLCLANEVIASSVSLAEHPSQNRNTAFFLRCAFLLRKAKVIQLLVRNDAALSERLGVFVTQLEDMLLGKQVSVARLNDVAQSAAIAKAKPSETISEKQLQKEPLSSSPPPSQSLHAVPFSRGRSRRKANRNQLHEAVLYGSTQLVQNCLTESPHLLLETDEDDETPLAYCAAIGRLNVLGILLCAPNPPLSQTNKNGETPLELAIKGGYWKTTDLLLSYSATLSTQCDRTMLFNHLILHRFFNTAARVISAGLIQIQMNVLQFRLPPQTLEWIMAKEAELALAKAASDSQSENKEKNELELKSNATKFLRKAVENGMVDLVRTLLKEGATPTASLLALCCDAPRGADVADVLLHSGTFHPDDNPNVDNKELENEEDKSKEKEKEKEKDSTNNYDTILFRASEKGLVDLVEVLISHGANVNHQNVNGNTPLWIASCNRRLECMTALLNAGSNPNLCNYRGDSPLMCAVQKNMCSGVEILLAAGALIHYEREPGVDETSVYTPVMVCCRMGHDVLLQRLLTRLSKQRNGQMKVESELKQISVIDGFCPIHAAAEQNYSECITILKQFGADLEMKTSPNNPILGAATPLHIASHYGSVEAAITLLELGANPNSTDIKGRTPLHLAVMSSNANLVRLLKSFKANLIAKDIDGRTASFYRFCLFFFFFDFFWGDEECLFEKFILELNIFLSFFLFSSLFLFSFCSFLFFF